MSKAARRIHRKGELYVVGQDGVQHPPGSRVAWGRTKTKDAWWTKRQAELAEKKRSVVPAKHPLDRKIERAMKKL